MKPIIRRSKEINKDQKVGWNLNMKGLSTRLSHFNLSVHNWHVVTSNGSKVMIVWSLVDLLHDNPDTQLSQWLWNLQPCYGSTRNPYHSPVSQIWLGLATGWLRMSRPFFWIHSFLVNCFNTFKKWGKCDYAFFFLFLFFMQKTFEIFFIFFSI